MFNRRCGAFTLLVTLALLANAPFAVSQALTMVPSTARSAGSSTSGFNGDFGSATTINLSNPSSIVFDSIGNQFVSDTLNNCVRKIDLAGNVTTVAGLAVSGQSDTCNTTLNPTPTAAQGLYKPTGLAIDSSNRLYIADSMHNCIRSIASGANGVANLTTVAGTCGSAPTASVTPAPNGLAIDLAGNLYIALQDSISATPVNQVVRHLSSAAATNVCLVAGAASANVAATCTGVTNGIALNGPSGLALNVTGDLFIADTGNNCVRQVVGLASSSASQATAVGQCLNDGSGSSATALHNPYGIAVSPMQSLFISESSPDNVVSYIPGSNVVRIVGGLPNGIAGSYDSSQDGKASVSTVLNNPRGLAFDRFANLFVADSLNNIIREQSANLHFPNTPVGSPSAIQPITFTVNQPVNISSSTGADYSITSSTCVGSLSPAPAGSVPNTCQVFVRFTPTRPGQRRSALKLIDAISNSSVYMGLQSVGTGALSLFSPGTPITVASGLATPAGITTDAAGNAYVLETATGSGTPDIRLIPAGGGSSSPVAGPGPGLVAPTAIASDAAGNWFVADATHGTVSRFGADGSVNASYVTGLDTPTALYIDLFNNLYIAQAGSAHNVIEAYTSGARRIVAGSGSNTAADGVTAASAAFISPSAITMDLNGTLYVADQAGHRVYAIDNSSIIHIAAGNGTTATTLAGQATGTAIAAPGSLAIDAAGDLYIADQSSGIIFVVYASSTSGNNIAAILNTSAPPAPNGALSIALDGSSNLFISKTATNSVIKITYPNPTLDFGFIMVGNTSAAKTQSITNAGTDNLSISSPFSTTDSHFAVDSSSTTCGTSILTGSVCTLGYTFTPTTNANYDANSIISSNSYNTPQPIALTGIGKQIVSLTISLAPQSAIYGQAFPETVTFGNITTAPTGTISYTTGGQTLCTLTGTFTASTTCNAPASGLSVGNYTVTFNYSGDSNYSAASGIVTLTVNPAPLTEIVDNATRAIGTSNPAFSGVLTGAVANDTILVAYSTTAVTSSPVGNYPITATLTAVGSASLSNYTITNTPGTLTITSGSLSYTLPAQTEVYGQPFPEPFAIAGFNAAVPPTGSISFTLPGKMTICSLNGTFTATNTCNAPKSGLAVGTYTVSFNYSGDTNYAPYSGTTTLTVTPALLTVAVANVTRAYGVANPAFSASITGTVAGDTFTSTFSTTATINSPVGTYPINDVLSGAALSNYTVTVIPGTLTITQASLALNVAVSSAARNYGAANPAFASVITGALNGDTFNVTYATSATITSPIGTYAIVPTVSGLALANYNLTTANGTLTVLPASLTVRANNASRAYGAANPTFTGTITGLVNGDTATVAYLTTASINSPVGSYPIVPSVSGASSNYAVSVVNGTLTVTANANSLVINVHSAARVYAAANPAFSGDVTGVVPGDDVVVTYTTNANAASSAGNYPIGASVSGTSAGNYIATIHPGTLAINPASTLTTVATSIPSAAIGTNVTFTANVSANSGTATGVVSFFDGTVLLGNANLTASGSAIFSTSALSIGSHTISAAFQANTNFTTSGASVTQVITQAVGAFTISANPPSPFIKGAGITTYQVTVTPSGAFAGQVALTCAGLPADATCTFATPVVNLTGGSSITTTMTVTTTVADAKLLAPAGLPAGPGDIAPLTFAAIFPAELTGLGVLFAGLRRRKTLGTQKMRLLLMIVFTLGILGLVGCGCPSTTFQTYTINITGTSLSFPAPAQTTSVLLSVGLQ